MYLSVLINLNGVSLLAECWAKHCSPFPRLYAGILDNPSAAV